MFNLCPNFNFISTLSSDNSISMFSPCFLRSTCICVFKDTIGLVLVVFICICKSTVHDNLKFLCAAGYYYGIFRSYVFLNIEKTLDSRGDRTYSCRMPLLIVSSSDTYPDICCLMPIQFGYICRFRSIGEA